MTLIGEQVSQPDLLAVGEQVGAGVQSASGPVQRVTGAAPSAEDVLLSALSAFVQGVGGQVDHVEGIHHGRDVRDLLDHGRLEPGEPIHRDDLDLFPPRLVAAGEPRLEGGLGTPFNHVQQPRRTGPIPHTGEVDDDGHVLVPAAATLSNGQQQTEPFSLLVDHNNRIDTRHGQPVRFAIEERSRQLLVDPYRDTEPINPRYLRELLEKKTTRPESSFLDTWLAARDRQAAAARTVDQLADEETGQGIPHQTRDGGANTS